MIQQYYPRLGYILGICALISIPHAARADYIIEVEEPRPYVPYPYSYDPYPYSSDIVIETVPEKSEAEKRDERKKVGKFILAAFCGAALSYSYDYAIHGSINRENPAQSDMLSRFARILASSTISVIPGGLVGAVSACLAEALGCPYDMPASDTGAYCGGFTYGVSWYILNEIFKTDPSCAINILSPNRGRPDTLRPPYPPQPVRPIHVPYNRAAPPLQQPPTIRIRRQGNWW